MSSIRINSSNSNELLILLKYDKVNNLKRGHDEVCICEAMNTSVSFLRYTGGNISEEIMIKSLISINPVHMKYKNAILFAKQITHVFTGSLIWLHYNPISMPSRSYIIQNLTLFNKQIDYLFPNSEVIYMLSPGLAQLPRLLLGPIPSNGIPYAVQRVNHIIEQYSYKHGYKVIHTKPLMEEMLTFLYSSSSNNNNTQSQSQSRSLSHNSMVSPPKVSQLFVDNFHPCVPSVDIPFVLIFLAGIIKPFWL